MEKVMQLIEGFLSLSAEQQVFVIAVLAMSLAGFALYIVLVVLKSSASKGGRQ